MNPTDAAVRAVQLAQKKGCRLCVSPDSVRNSTNTKLFTKNSVSGSKPAMATRRQEGEPGPSTQQQPEPMDTTELAKGVESSSSTDSVASSTLILVHSSAATGMSPPPRSSGGGGAASSSADSMDTELLPSTKKDDKKA